MYTFEKFEDIEEKSFEKYINADKMINGMEIKFDNINISKSFDNLSKINDNKYLKNNMKLINKRNKKFERISRNDFD